MFTLLTYDFSFGLVFLSSWSFTIIQSTTGIRWVIITSQIPTTLAGTFNGNKRAAYAFLLMSLIQRESSHVVSYEINRGWPNDVSTN